MKSSNPASTRLSRPALLLIVSDTVLQGARYAFILYLGYESVSLLGSFLFGAAVGALFAVVVDFGIGQHWIRLEAADPALTRAVFNRVLLAKSVLSVLGMALIIGIAAADALPVTNLPVMAAGLFLTILQGLAESCEAMGLARHRYHLVSVFRILFSLTVYGFPVLLSIAATSQTGETTIHDVLSSASIAGLLLFGLYVWNIARSLPSVSAGGIGYRHAWWAARWLGVNQAAIVVDVRAPLVILGIMLGDTAVGLYGLVQRTTAIVELAWASLSKLLLKSYAETVSASGPADVRARMLAAGKVTGLIMAGVMIFGWTITMYIQKMMELSEETAVALSLLRWGLVAISLSSLKRPLIAGLLALYQDRTVSRINLLSAAAGLLLIPLLILSLGIWGPAIGWILLEGAACILLVRCFLSIPSTPQSNLGESVPQRAGV
jgi:O-antigen/teichoic acid export membrane protein